ncbi:MAG: glycosyltransferase [Clostridia bacterium]|nr:glycosyltransferase [Clostridia bacterium]
MNILFVTASLGLGGSEKCMAEMIRRIDLTKYNVTILSLIKGSYIYRFDERIRVINGVYPIAEMTAPTKQYVLNIKNWKSPKKIISKIKMALECKNPKYHIGEYIWENIKPFVKNFDDEFDAVIGYGQGMATYFTIDKVTRAKKKILWLNTDLVKAHYNIDYISNFYNQADAIAADSQNGKKLISILFPKMANKTVCVPNMLNVDDIKEKSALYHPEIDNTCTSILTVGRLCEAKAIHLAVEAATILKNAGYNFKWYIVGDGSDRSKISAKINELGVADRFILLGSNNNPYPWFANCDIYVQTSIYEGSCMTINEAMIFSKPIVTTNFEAAYEKITENNGIITEMNGGSIANAIKKLLDNPALKNSLSEFLSENQPDYDNYLAVFYSLLNS